MGVGTSRMVHRLGCPVSALRRPGVLGRVGVRLRVVFTGRLLAVFDSLQPADEYVGTVEDHPEHPSAGG